MKSLQFEVWRNVKYLDIAITPSATVTWSNITYGLNISV